MFVKRNIPLASAVVTSVAASLGRLRRIIAPWIGELVPYRAVPVTVLVPAGIVGAGDGAGVGGTVGTGVGAGVGIGVGTGAGTGVGTEVGRDVGSEFDGLTDGEGELDGIGVGAGEITTIGSVDVALGTTAAVGAGNGRPPIVPTRVGNA